MGLRGFLGKAMQFLDDFQREGKKLTSESWQSLEEQFPEQVKAWKERFPSIFVQDTDGQTTAEKTVS
ncbi:hypothetical protein OESDEN_19958 [Oesophagostomum dentatum]|uniref:Uncharacterized protein n=1 Tax=Oesophagostomum dentatum TaxID=61180 RepID=A0A0B1S604_OESDE|nr:hypothetical protein OESDEN_19958 [Oesophagostomum dentatum]